MAYIFFSTSGEKLNVVKVLHKTQIWNKPEAIWLIRAKMILRVPVETLSEH